MKILFAISLLLANAAILRGEQQPSRLALMAQGGKIRVQIVRDGQGANEVIEILQNGKWTGALSTRGFVTRVTSGTPANLQACAIKSLKARKRPAKIVIISNCATGSVQRVLSLTTEPDAISVQVQFTPNPGTVTRSVEDRYVFVPGRRASDTQTSGPVDFVWSQNLKNESDGLIPQWGFKSPVVMLQQGAVLAALMPALATHSEPHLALDLDVTSEAKPWMSYGAVASEPYGHSYFRRSSNSAISTPGKTIDYAYTIVASPQPLKLGYRRIVRRLWQTMGHEALLMSKDLQKNVRQPELETFDEWRREAWIRYADEVYRQVDCPAGGGNCGTLLSNRNYLGYWDKPEEDAWFNSWFQSLRTAYGWYLYGRKTQNADIQRKAESVLTLALQSPQQDGAFPTIYLVSSHRWIKEDGWAGFSDDYHAFCMSWTAYWMLRWAEELTPNRKGEITAFVRRYGDFLVQHQRPSGVIPSWFDAELKPRQEFRDLNAETAGSALLLLRLGEVTGEKTYTDAGTRAMEFVSREVLPRQLWWDFETFKSCARKNFDFYDRVTAQYPQNNLSTMQAAMAYLELYRTSKERKWLQKGSEVLDYLLLTQQVWNPPYFDPKLLGGFTTQNTDAEWSDARQCYAAVLLLDYYKETGEAEYLERAVGAARATFAVAPWENWAHTGFKNEPGSMTGFHWGTGSAMTSVEIMSGTLGDAFVDLRRKHAVGFNGSTLTNLRVSGNTISFEAEAVPKLQELVVRFAGVNQTAQYRIVVNHQAPVIVFGNKLASDGYTLRLDAGN
ncbi:MAG: hypothetical protein JSS69_01100 [Acidobacteria bacterium]|nr:hypothetical protein [Acidobacteriota bacterium]MBS1864490.1 hypothetical protein [Acidobacteriota bacterium]